MKFILGMTIFVFKGAKYSHGDNFVLFLTVLFSLRFALMTYLYNEYQC